MKYFLALLQGQAPHLHEALQQVSAHQDTPDDVDVPPMKIPTTSIVAVDVPLFIDEVLDEPRYRLLVGYTIFFVNCSSQLEQG